MKKAYVCPKTRPLSLAQTLMQFPDASNTGVAGDGAPVMGNDVKGTAASGRLW